MQEKTPAQILREAAAYIEANGVLFDGWESEDGTEDLPPCCCVAGTMRLVSGAKPKPLRKVFATEALKSASVALADQTRPERIVLGTERFDIEDDELDIIEWSDHYADTEVVCRKQRSGRPEFRRLEHSDGDRRHVAAAMRQAALRCEDGTSETAQDRVREYLSQVPEDYWDKKRPKPSM